MVLPGTAVYSFALDNPKGSTDWRQDVTQGGVRVESIAKPDEIRQQVLAFTQKSGPSLAVSILPRIATDTGGFSK
jgi:hypothetical protein